MVERDVTFSIYYMANGLTYELLTKFLRRLGHDLEMTCTKFHENRLIIDDKSTRETCATNLPE